MGNPIMGMIMQMMKNGGNPQQMLQSMMGNNAIMQNPVAKNILGMAKNGDVAGVEQLGRNIAKERGVDFDQEFSKFKSQFPGM